MGNTTLAWYNESLPGEGRERTNEPHCGKEMLIAFSGLTWANNIQSAYAVSNVSAFLYWIGASNSTTNSNLIRLRGDTVTVSKRLWAFAQFSRFVKPGAVRIDASSGNAALKTTAFKNSDGSIAVQVINNGNATESLSIQGLATWGKHARSYLTNNEEDLAEGSVRLIGSKLYGSVPAKSMISYVLK